MKYMGSKLSMLKNGLGNLICARAQFCQRVVDLFCGAGSVAWFAAENTSLPVLAIDLQSYASTLARAVIGRVVPLDADNLVAEWLGQVSYSLSRSPLWRRAVAMEESASDICVFVQASRTLCTQLSKIGPIWNAYGGYYFSPKQALTFDYMLKYLPECEPKRSVCLAATIITASKCAAAPGHTAQPFRPTGTAAAFLWGAWKKDSLSVCKRVLYDLCPRHANVVGQALVGNAIDISANLLPDDLVIIDPPYSGVQYSRFYHVLETIAQAHCVSVTGAGRYPPIGERPQSAFSKISQSNSALKELLYCLAKSGCTVIFTFPAGQCTNGLSGQHVIQTAGTWYDVDEKVIHGSFSTLGGNNTHRAPRQSSDELLLLFRPKPCMHHADD